VWPFTISLALYIAIQVFGPLMFTESFHYTPGEAAAMNSWFWGGKHLSGSDLAGSARDYRARDLLNARPATTQGARQSICTT